MPTIFWAVIAIIFGLIAAFLEFFEVRFRSKPHLHFRRGDVSAYISGTIWGVIAVLAFLAVIGVIP